MPTSCSNCSESVHCSVVVTLSSIGARPRVQSYSTAVLFCERCIREFIERLCSEQLQTSVNGALTTLHQRLRENSSAQKKILD
jgi:hypothetical protein